MLIQEFVDKVEMVRRYRASEVKQPAKVMNALGTGYRVRLPIGNETYMFNVKGKELERLLAEFPGVTELWRLFAPA